MNLFETPEYLEIFKRHFCEEKISWKDLGKARRQVDFSGYETGFRQRGSDGLRANEFDYFAGGYKRFNWIT